MSETTIYVIPADGREVRDPDTLQLLPREGALVPRNLFYARRIADGDVTEGEAPAPEIEDPAPEPEAEPAA